ncbi:hypothetical protein C2845_PM11G16180 [Panicum miliaceum]|uniref:Protein FAR1-RELATED SEQUENCE n=1 Tax=Panicum miliaceum TaxID=4540 RepID=A0A3L6RT58_PANMI|nr:hypothetical protein C2845_PM11G16180 [Panicum miliaceum]
MGLLTANYGYNIERQASELYNRNIFKKFQYQLQLTERLKYKETEKGKCYEVWAKTNQIYKPHRIRTYIVLADVTEGREQFSCICGKFNKDGILCSHILKIIVEEDINVIPEKYFIDRWRKKGVKMKLPLPELVPKTHEMLRFNILSRKSTILNSKGSKSEEVMQYLSEEYEKIDKNLELMLSETRTEANSTQSASRAQENAVESSSSTLRELPHLNDPTRVKQKGRPALPTRLKPRIEEIKQKIAREEKMKAKKSNQISPKGKAKKKMRKGSEENIER